MRIANAQRIDGHRDTLEQAGQIIAFELGGIIDSVAEQNDGSRWISAQPAALGHGRQGVEERGLSVRGNRGQRIRNRRRLVGEGNHLARFRFGKDPERKVISGLTMGQQRADRGAGGVHLAGQAHRSGAVEQDRERHRRVLRPLEHVAAYGLAVHEEPHLPRAQIGERSSLRPDGREGNHHVADGDRLIEDALGLEHAGRQGQRSKPSSCHRAHNVCR